MTGAEVGAGAGVGSAGGTAAVCCRSAGPGGRVVGGVAEVTGSGAAGPGRVSGVRVTDGFPVIGAPRPIRRTPVEALRCTGYGPDPAGAAGAVRLGPETGGFAAAGPDADGVLCSVGPAAARWTTGAVPEGAWAAALLAGAVVPLGPTGAPADALAVRLGVAAALWTRTGESPVPAGAEAGP
ncbi:hypothetical protein [Streptomyces sp. NPDC055210]